MTVEMTMKQSRELGKQATEERLPWEPLRIELTNEEILADLHYPAPVRRQRSG